MRRYEPLIGAILAGLRLPCGCERSDIAQEARIGLVRAIWAWRPERGPFGAFASRCARDQAINAIDTAGARKHQLLTRAVSLHSIIVRSRRPSDIGETAFESPLHERLSETRPLADPVRTVLAREQIDEIRAALSRLTGKERAALIGDLNGISQQQVASEQGTTEKAVPDRCAGHATSSEPARSGSPPSPRLARQPPVRRWRKPSRRWSDIACDSPGERLISPSSRDRLILPIAARRRASRDRGGAGG